MLVAIEVEKQVDKTTTSIRRLRAKALSMSMEEGIRREIRCAELTTCTATDLLK